MVLRLYYIFPVLPPYTFLLFFFGPYPLLILKGREVDLVKEDRALIPPSLPSIEGREGMEAGSTNASPPATLHFCFPTAT